MRLNYSDWIKVLQGLAEKFNDAKDAVDRYAYAKAIESHFESGLKDVKNVSGQLEGFAADQLIRIVKNHKL